IEGRQFFTDAARLPLTPQSADELARMIAQYASTAAPPPTFDPDATFGVRLPVRREEAMYAYLADVVGGHIAGATGLKRQNSLVQALQLLRTLAAPVRNAIIRPRLGALCVHEARGRTLRGF